MKRVLLLSTYELGARPLGIGRPAAALVAAGHEVRAVDLSVETLTKEDLVWTEAIVIAVPMHTAARLGLELLGKLRAARPQVPIAFHGLYAPVLAGDARLGPRDLLVAGEAVPVLVDWVGALDGVVARASRSGPVPVRVELGPARPAPEGPASFADLPDLSAYAHLLQGDTARLVGTVETSTGCNHTCRHCPVPTVYAGRSRERELGTVEEEIDALVAAGAEHVHFADPDFLNRPAHALRVVESLARRHRGISFDITAKVSHLLRYDELVGRLATAGLAFVVSAFESTSPLVLERLAKGHLPDEAAHAVAALRRHGVEPRPSFLPFTPWTTRNDIVDLLDFVARHDLVPNVDPVQYGIRLLLPPGSLLLKDPDPVLSAVLGAFEPDALGYSWRSPDPLLDLLSAALAERAEKGAETGEETEETYEAIRGVVFEMLGEIDPGQPDVATIPGPCPKDRPRLSESWFCCAEPTKLQRAIVSS